MIEDYERLATGRDQSLFANDMETHDPNLRNAIAGARVAILGAAGSIGSALVSRIVEYGPAHLALIDLSENSLVEVVRDLRSRPGLAPIGDLETLPIGLGSREFERYFADREPFDIVFNLCAIKHVRSERDPYGIARMVDTNILFLDEFLSSLPYDLKHLFSVSSDKATAPASLMGASKFGMELILDRHSQRHPYSTARFANVAFSEGSLLQGFLRRIEKRQPIAAPQGIRRFFMSHLEAADLCLLAGMLGRCGEIFFPKPGGSLQERSLPEIAVATLGKAGYEAIECESESEAKGRFEELVSKGQWPCYFADSETSGEKPFEEFHSDADEVDSSRFESVGVIDSKRRRVDGGVVDEFLRFARGARMQGATKAEYVAAFRALLGEFDHVETGRNLDQGM
jgi:FlaA1/EpsC-like NDP-sugar epimerase